MAVAVDTSLKQHLIDPETCIRCGTCEGMCPEGAISHDDANYVVDPDLCRSCLACIGPCPTGAIDSYRKVPRAEAYSVATQLDWNSLPGELAIDGPSGDGIAVAAPVEVPAATSQLAAGADAVSSLAREYGSTVPPWSAAHPYANLYGSANPATATVVGNLRVTEAGREYETHHIILDFGKTPFPILEGQSIGIVPPGVDAAGEPYRARQYSIASARDGERPGYNNLSLTVKRVVVDYDGNPVRGVASNYLCDLSVGDEVDVIGPFGTSFLMPNHPRSHIVMVCTGTGAAPMRAMIHRQHRQRTTAGFEAGRMMLFFGARTTAELPYFGRLDRIPKDLVDVNLAFSRIPDTPKRYVQDVMRERSADIAELLADPDAYFYVCGLRNMEEGVVLALKEIAEEAGLRWQTIGPALKNEGRLHLETF
jgi:benzoyl-CoA 2,3-dioxygenase component A